ncbi:RAB11-binding protein RELCH homolog isoform X3 [Biomphalaria glabrata]|uniref:RAB11-binding protein RELCH homolog isoform X3 n=1 Tax=Biomphalaria glabrata TaxID=6526 RepID=A0A9W3AXL1_BIOGL|nr:RAB11-binding protein RELCH homolog isoform X3 [Biomphalaria glabrata]
MADSGNPFIESDVSDAEDDNDFVADIKQSNKTMNKQEANDTSWDNIAAKLLKDNYILTALELYTEFIESGRDLPRLRDYFSNPGNFERTKEDTPSPTLPRTSSVQTFDSLDFARYSDDGERQVDERVAVLEFELRKAQETIKSLRASLTQQAETELSTPENQYKGGLGAENSEAVTPLEKKALNFLVNEYLLQANYKVTSVTFAEENEEQDFEDWDDVGLNIPRPPGLVHLLKDYSSHVAPSKDTCDACVDVDLDTETLVHIEAQWKARVESLELKIESLEQQLKLSLEENTTLSQQIDIFKIGGGSRNESLHQTDASMPSRERSQPDDIKIQIQTLTNDDHIRPIGSSLDDLRPDDSDLHPEGTHSPRALTDSVDSTAAVSHVIGEREEGEGQEEVQGKILLAVAPDAASDHSDTSLSINSRLDSKDHLTHQLSSKHLNKRKMTDSFRQALLDVAFHVSQDNRIVSEMSRINHSDSQGVVKMLSRCLPHIVPNVLLAKREELIPVILCTAILHPEPKQRDQLLNILFNLIKKPDDDQRQMILTGCVVFAELAGADRLVEELLPQCWEQIGHKFVERRLLVAEACGALSSYLPAEIRSSLVLSMLQQMMLDDRDEEVREAVVRSLGLLMGFICDADKYVQGYDLLMAALKDPKEKVHRAALQVFLPALGMWSRELGRLEHHLMHNLLKHLEDTVKGAVAAQKVNSSTSLPLNESRFLLLLSTLEELIPLLYLTVIETCPSSSTPTEQIYVDFSRYPRATSPLNDLLVMCGGEQALVKLASHFESHIDQEWFEPWEEINWIVNNLLPRILEVTSTVGLSMQKVVHSLSQFMFCLSRTFGRTFTEKKVKQKFEELVNIPVDELETRSKQGHLPLTTCIVPVYASGVLLAFVTEEDKACLNQFLKKVLCTLAYYQTSLDSMRATLIELSENPANHDLLLSVLWEGVVHTSSQVRTAAASLFELMIKGVSDSLVSSRVVPALVTLSNDHELSVRIATIPSLGSIIEHVTIREVLDRVYMQLQMFFDEPIYRDQHTVHVELIRTLARCGPSAEPKFRDEFILPRLAAMASANNHVTNETKRTDIAKQLFEAYSAISCCFLSQQLVAEAMLPGLKCLKQDMEALGAEHLEVVNAMIRDYQSKLDIKTLPAGPVEDIRTSVMSKIKDTTSKANIGNIFNRKK